MDAKLYTLAPLDVGAIDRIFYSKGFREHAEMGRENTDGSHAEIVAKAGKADFDSLFDSVHGILAYEEAVARFGRIKI